MAYGQSSCDKCERIAATPEFFIADSLTIIPQSVKVVPSDGISIDQDLDHGRIKITYTGTSDSLEICYRTLPYALNQDYKNRSLAEYDSGNSLMKFQEFRYTPITEKRQEIFRSDSLSKSGSISRGVSFGNNQDLYVNSALNLQMDGKLSPSLNVRASITDQNIPYQPEGNTVLVQDFDNVYIELYNKNFSLLGGDMMLKGDGSYFLQYQRNVMGARFKTDYKTWKSGNAESSIAVSESKGRFASYTIEPIDGVMGPYRIYGPGHEKFMIILANSEKVYLDGQLLQRGFNNDYIIDYNTAEITFTASVLITKYSRIVVDFQYNDESYGRSLVSIQHDQNIGKLQLHLNYYEEKDDPGQSFNLPISDNQKTLLAGIQSIDNYGLIPGGDSVGYDPGKVLYKMKDTLDAEGKRISIYVYSTDPDSAVYQVTFMDKGAGRGNYRQRILSSGISVYDWVFPEGGSPQGEYEPLRSVPLPEKKQMMDIAATYSLTKYENIKGELAASGYDHNLYSPHTGNISGNAFRVGVFSENRPINANQSLFYNGNIDMEYSGRHFSPIDRYRPVEYDRDWSFDPSVDSTFTPDLTFTVRNGIHGKHGYLDHQVSRRVKENFFDGWQNKVDGSVDLARLNISGNFYLMNNNMSFSRSNWLRYNIRTQYRLGYFMPGYQYTSDRNIIFNTLNDSITGSNMNYDEHLFFIKNSDSLKTKFNVQYSIRKDRIPILGEIVDNDLSRTFGFNIDHGNARKGKIGIGLYYRKLNNVSGNEAGDKSLNGKLTWDQPIFKNLIRSQLEYSIGSGRELKREYTYIQVPDGQGTHTWRDDNGDGIKQLNEFYPAMNDDERNYIKIFIPTDDYILAYENMLNYRLTTDLPDRWRGHSGLLKFLSRFSNALTVNADQKNSSFGFMSHILDNSVHTFDPSILAQHGRLRNTLYFNRKNPGFGMDMTYDISNSKNLFTQGFEGRSTRDIILNTRFNFDNQYSALIGADRGQNINGSDYLTGRNYSISSDQVNTSISWQPTNFYRVTLNFTRTTKVSTGSESEAESSRINDGGIIFRVSKADSRAIECRFSLSRINFNGEQNSPAGYELLNGLQPGNNAIWSLNWQQNLINGLQMNIVYEGRKSGDLKIIHTGRMQVTALF